MIESASALIASTRGNTVVAPSVALIVFSVLAGIAVPCGFVTAAKGRWGWLALGFLTSGVLWMVGAIQAPRPASLWLRLRARRARRLRAT